MKTARLFILTQFSLLIFTPGLFAEDESDKESRRERWLNADLPLKIEQLWYRPAKWETERVTEPVNEKPNRGGLIRVYFKNTADESIELRTWHANGKSASYHRQAGSIAWDSLAETRVSPNHYGVLEISATDAQFAPGREIEFAFIQRNWKPGGVHMGTLSPPDLEIALIGIHENRTLVEAHIKNQSSRPVTLTGLTADKYPHKAIEYTAKTIAPRSQTIARLRLKRSIPAGRTLILRADYTDHAGNAHSIFAHRRAHDDTFPIGTWGIGSDRYGHMQDHGFDTFVRGRNLSDPFFDGPAQEHNFSAMVHVGVYPEVDLLRARMKTPQHIAAWMPQDEPDWSFTPQFMLASCEMTHKYGPEKPVMVTLCRNVKFFEYAPLADIPCHDHYCVGAPSTSKWPTRYGTRLEETAYYTRDLKYASEPKPIWVWTQGLFSGWDSRPNRPVPTISELSAQLVLNLSRGAKGILWFTFSEKRVNEYPAAAEAIKNWNRFLQDYRDDLLRSEPANANAVAPDKLDVALLAAWDTAFVTLVNTDYLIDDTAYKFTPLQDASIAIDLPAWITPHSVTFIDHTQRKEIPLQVIENSKNPAASRIQIENLSLTDTAILVIK